MIYYLAVYLVVLLLTVIVSARVPKIRSWLGSPLNEEDSAFDLVVIAIFWPVMLVLMSSIFLIVLPVWAMSQCLRLIWKD